MLTARFREALIFAAQLHAGQTRKGKPVPYISHLMAVSGLVLDYGGSEDQAIAGLLHDAIEDQGGAAARARILKLFGENVTRIVDGCTDSDVMPKPAWRPRKEEYLRHLREAPEDVRLVSLSDKVHNLRCIVADYRVMGEKLWARFQGGKEGTLWYYYELVKIFNALGPFPLAGELDRTYRELNELVRATDSN